MFRKFASGFSRAVDRLLRSLPGILHTTGTAADPDAATTMEKLDAALNNMSHGLCMFGPDNRLLLWNERYVKMYRLAPDKSEGMLRWKTLRIACVAPRHLAPRCDRPQCIASSAFDEAPGRFLPCLPLRKRMSISVPLTRTSSHRR